ncbi:MAG: radical SAM protein [Deltaproteobacteria bacterium]|jgi:radical SAM protein with 4Fe4S-binding SPASM domain|nr:radical SAM protein [Deltaproteobacteria bacterium]
MSVFVPPDTLLPLEVKPPFRHVRGYGYEALLPEKFEAMGNIVGQSMRSPLEFCENGKALPVRHAQNIGIWYAGGGHYNHVGRCIYFSLPDNSDPNTNGRRYTVRAPKALSPQGGRPFPKRVHVVLSHTCNLWCRICREAPFSGPVMEMALFDKIAGECFAFATELRLDSGGEILLNNRLPSILRRAAEYGLPIFASSNGMLLTPKKARLIAESTVHHIQISVDSPVKETLEWIRRGANFERIKRGLRNLVRARKDVGRPFLISIHAAVMRENVRQLPDLVRFASELGIEGVTACHLFAHDCMGIDSSCFWSQAEYDDMRARAIELARSLDSFFYGPQPFAEAAENNCIAGWCDYPEYGTYINPDGTVMPCCIAPNFPLGVMNTQSFTEIWNGERYEMLRRTYRTDAPSLARCKACLVQEHLQDYMAFFSPAHWEKVRRKMEASSHRAQNFAK